jgi:hypothetical protein
MISCHGHMHSKPPAQIRMACLQAACRTSKHAAAVVGEMSCVPASCRRAGIAQDAMHHINTHARVTGVLQVTTRCGHAHLKHGSPWAGRPPHRVHESRIAPKPGTDKLCASKCTCQATILQMTPVPVLLPKCQAPTAHTVQHTHLAGRWAA